MQRVFVGLGTKNGKYKVPKFSECLVDSFAKNANSVVVNFSLENGILILNEAEHGYELMHSPDCPIKILSNSKAELDNYISHALQSSEIGVATSVVIESSDAHVLLTKRSSNLRASPNVWVMPGGHLEKNETIFEAGIREVQEETGLDISNSKPTFLGLWENVYPLILGAGVPKNHVLIVYLHAKLNETHEQLTKKLIPNPEEVDSYCWLNSFIVNKIFYSSDSSVIEGKQFVCENGGIIEKYLDHNKMFNKWLNSQPLPYSGVNYSLRKWMKKVNPSCKF